MRRFMLPVMLIALALSAQGCTSNGELALNTVTDSEYASVKRLRTGEYSLISNQDLAELKREADIGKGVGRYQIHVQAFRTWRLDTATGQVCLLLAPEKDWKKPDIAAQACNP